MPDHRTIYQKHATQYAQLVACEDYEGHLLPALRAIRPLADADIVETGAGTGRLTRLIAPLCRRIIVCDASSHMLAKARTQLPPGLLAAAADHRHLPVPDASADLILSGWSVCMLAVWYPETWRAERWSARSPKCDVCCGLAAR